MAPRLVEEADDTKDVPPETADEAVADEVTDKVSEEAKAPETPAADESDGADEAVGAAGPVALTKNTAESDSASAGTAADDDEDGPVFDISDRRASMTADRAGVRFQLDETEAEFGWDEIGAVEVETPRFGRRFTVTLHTTGRRHYQSDVDAPSRSSLKAWTAELDAVLDRYFEES
ncbi:hypothetical protein [Streptomyces niveus]|uniref:hypothetical protein n=1 Tax=Streptomyces niveus TaxID=193462 RepID=UPI002E3421D3|nr:hypothetical protein [Streptomyces niveus]